MIKLTDTADSADVIQHVHNHGPTWWQVVAIAVLSIAAYDLVRFALDEASDRLAGIRKRVRERYERFREEYYSEPIEDAAEDPETGDYTPWTPPPRNFDYRTSLFYSEDECAAHAWVTGDTEDGESGWRHYPCGYVIDVDDPIDIHDSAHANRVWLAARQIEFGDPIEQALVTVEQLEEEVLVS